jgi:hypothetical protein
MEEVVGSIPTRSTKSHNNLNISRLQGPGQRGDRSYSGNRPKPLNSVGHQRVASSFMCRSMAIPVMWLASSINWRSMAPGLRDSR